VPNRAAENPRSTSTTSIPQQLPPNTLVIVHIFL
jgi:hypothetical protein